MFTLKYWFEQKKDFLKRAKEAHTKLVVELGCDFNVIYEAYVSVELGIND